MQYVRLGRTGLRVSPLVLGTMNFGRRISPEDSHAIMDRALEMGLNFFDTADVYGGRKYEGYTEQILGDYFAQGGKRDRIVLATKLHNRMGDGPNDRGLSAYHIKRACEASLKRLRVDHIDLYQMHHIDRDTPWEEIYQAMEQLVREGKITYVGSSNFAGWHVATACQEAARQGFLGIVSEQTKFSLSCRTPELEVLPACRHYGVGLIAWSPLDGGFLGGLLGLSEGEGLRRAQEAMQKRIEKQRDQLEQWEKLCSRLGKPPAVVALAWVLQQPGVTGPIIGPRTVEQLEESMQALELQLDEATLQKLDEIFPGPGKPAPEAYAW